jgi:hypothetical protein
VVLETHRETIVDAVDGDIVEIVARLVDRGEAYVVLGPGAGSETYVQAAGTVEEDFIVERRDGCAGEHYRGDRRLSADELATLLVKYLRGDPAWSHVVTWHRVQVDRAPANA